jgi:hypothetical protein
VKILLDHCVPKTFRHELPQHEVSTAREMGWEALKNGDLLDKAQKSGFEIFITVDQNVRYQQNLKSRAIAVCVLISDGITIEKLRVLVPKLEVVLPAVQVGNVYELTT